jgi:F0F1-type ATP synthase assembly protein I
MDKQPNPYVRFAGMGFEMLITIFIGVFIGRKLDKYFGVAQNYWTLGLTLLFIGIGFYNIVRKLPKP